MTDLPEHRIEGRRALRERYRDPGDYALRKDRGRVDEAAASFVAASPFLVLATNGPGGADASPRGGPPGFVAVLDDGHLAFGDLSGNNRLDSYSNVVDNPEVGMVFFVPGLEESLRVNGRAHLTSEPSVLDRTTVGGVRPKVAFVVTVRECYIHCGKAIRRSGLWQPDQWLSPEERPSPPAIMAEHLGETTAAEQEARLEGVYRTTLWREGGA